jgi:hypothetical protein
MGTSHQKDWRALSFKKLTRWTGRGRRYDRWPLVRVFCQGLEKKTQSTTKVRAPKAFV